MLSYWNLNLIECIVAIWVLMDQCLLSRNNVSKYKVYTKGSQKHSVRIEA